MARWLKTIDDVLKVKVHHLQTGRIKNSEFIDWVDKQPTIEAEPVKHGKWTQTYASWSQDYDTSKNIRYRCSECNGIAVWDTKYCPSCGARMDGAIDEN